MTMSPSTRAGFLRGVVAAAATYTYFLLFAQFGFLHLMEARLSADLWRPAMGAMGLAGLVTSLATARLLVRRPDLETAVPRLAFVGCGSAAVASLLCSSGLAFALVAAAVGVFTGALTVSLATVWRRLLGGVHLGLGAGLGTGLAYWICNIPALFSGSPELKVGAVAVACAVGAAVLGAAVFGDSRSLVSETLQSAEHPALGRDAWLGRGFVAVVIPFTALIWLDSAAFLIIQETDIWKGATWAGAERQWTLGLFHLVAAILAGRLIDAGVFRALWPVSWVLFVVAFMGIQNGATWAFAGGPIYVVGISFYSTALMVFASLGAPHVGIAPAWRAAWLFGIAGWVGSAAGVGMAQDLNRIPDGFLAITGCVILGAVALGTALSERAEDRVRGLWVRRHVSLGLGLGIGLLMVVFSSPSSLAGPQVSPPDESPILAAGGVGELKPEWVARGRRIYIREGCIHCHSQYIRPATDDVVRYGPHRPIDRDDAPALIGNRRQGPDLTWAGRYRSRRWLRDHLLDPRALSPGSRMPTFAHLFPMGVDEDGLSDGDALVAYLASKQGGRR